MKCKTCNGAGAVLADLNCFRFGVGFRQFMSAGCFQQQDERGTTRHEITCPRCDGTGVVVEESATDNTATEG